MEFLESLQVESDKMLDDTEATASETPFRVASWDGWVGWAGPGYCRSDRFWIGREACDSPDDILLAKWSHCFLC